jgi:hypothetical protein
MIEDGPFCLPDPQPVNERLVRATGQAIGEQGRSLSCFLRSGETFEQPRRSKALESRN